MASKKKRKKGKKMKKHRNTTLACVAHNDPARFRTRTVEPEHKKQTKSRARRKEVDRRGRSEEE